MGTTVRPSKQKTTSSLITISWLHRTNRIKKSATLSGMSTIKQEKTKLVNLIESSQVQPHFSPKRLKEFWQCKEQYHNQSEILESANKFREMEILVDKIVQDWLYWGSLGLGPHWNSSPV
mmetsp:Transcript_5500/g.7982  ORF Transcript_5500/g.7982 Transcript_5500/m.7982 type:complete len:120 (-) Transcript_5500:42-401(-)